MLSGGNQTDGNSLERFLTPYQSCQYSRLPLKSEKDARIEYCRQGYIVERFTLYVQKSITDPFLSD